MKSHNRHSIRLPNWDYSSSAYYFITICAYKRECLFGEIVNGAMVTNDSGAIISKIWFSLPDHHNIELDEFQIMPNHIHGIIIISSGVLPSRGVAFCRGVARYAPTRNKHNLMSQISPVSGSISTIVRSFKSECTKQIRQFSDLYIVWQRNYYEHIIRSEIELLKIKQYISDNPSKWQEDKNNPNNFTKSYLT